MAASQWDEFCRRLACAGIDVKFHDDHNTGEHIGGNFPMAILR